jgi:nucleoid-associated protein YgaU
MRLSRSGWALTTLSAGLVAVLAPDAAQFVRDIEGTSFPAALMAVGSLIALALAAWSLLSVATILLGGSCRLVGAITPAMMRRALLAGAAGALIVGPAHAEQLAAPDSQRHSVDGLPLPDRPDVVEVVHRDSAPSSVIEVRRGDTLWAIAARSLSDDASDAEIAAATARWHRANRDVIGDDPDLIFPAQHLTPPTGKEHP